jgi:hypothetical protein
MNTPVRLGIILAIVLISGALSSIAIVFGEDYDSNDDGNTKKYFKNSLKKICKDKDERKMWHCKSIEEMKETFSELIKQIKKNTNDINQINEVVLPNTLQTCNGINEVIRFTEAQGWTCEILDIPRFECSGHGTFQQDSNMCKCNEGFTGEQCDQLTIIPAGTTIHQIKPSSCESGKGWCPDGTTNSFDFTIIPGADFDSAIIMKVDGLAFDACTLEYRTASKIFRLTCAQPPSAESIFSYVVLIP